MQPGNELIFLPLGGSGEIGMNANLYGCQGKWILCDLGMTFADPSLPGVELVLPDLSFIEERRADLLGILLTHGHEDHIGAIPYLAADLGVPLYATAFTAGLIRGKLEEEGIAGEVPLHVVPNGGTVDLGPFRATWVQLAHSIPEANALVIDTPHGRLFHTGDWKLDDRPVLGDPASAAELQAIGANEGRGTLALIGDSTNVFNAKASGSESDVLEGLLQVVQGRKRGRVLVTTFASNAARLDTIGKVAAAAGRRLVVVGVSLERVIEIGKSCGYLRSFPEPLSWDAAASHPPEQLLLVATGTQGEPRAALARMADNSHPLKLEAGDLVVYSSKQIPGNEVAIGRVQNALAARGIEIVTERQAHVHVSGHPGRPELEAMYGWIRPKIAVPVHGERRHMEAHARLALDLGVEQAIVPMNGHVIRLAPGPVECIGHEAHGRLVLDGEVILPADSAAIANRRKMAWGGHLVATLVVDRSRRRLAAEPVVVARGLPIEEDEGLFLAEAAKVAAATFQKVGLSNRRRLEDELKVALRRVARQWTGKKPLTDLQLVEL